MPRQTLLGKGMREVKSITLIKGDTYPTNLVEQIVHNVDERAIFVHFNEGKVKAVAIVDESMKVQLLAGMHGEIIHFPEEVELFPVDVTRDLAKRCRLENETEFVPIPNV